MKTKSLIAVLLLALLYGASGPLVPVHATSRGQASDFNKHCHGATKKAHGKNKRKACRAPTPTPTATTPPAQLPFSGVAGLAVDSQGNLYLAELGNCRVTKLAPDGHFLMTLGAFTDCDPIAGFGPYDVAVDSKGNVYVTDSAHSTVVELSPDGQLLRTLGTYGHGPGQFSFPTMIAIGPNDSVYVADGDNDRIGVFSSDGQFRQTIGHGGSGPGELDFPIGVAVDKAGNVYVGDHRNRRVEKFAPDGTFLAEWSLTAAPVVDGVAVDAAGNVYVQPPLQRITPSGVISLWGQTGGNTVVVDSHDTVWAVDQSTGSDRVDKLGPDGQVVSSWDRPTGQ